MNWIRKTVFFVSLLIIAFFVLQESNTAVQKIEVEKTDTNFSKESTDSSAFIQPQSSYQLAANIKTNPLIIKWFDTLLEVVPQYQLVKSASNFANQFSAQNKKVLLMLYPFHFFLVVKYEILIGKK